MILVTGATGNVGGAVVAELCTRGVPTRALVRTPERAETLRGYDCEVVEGDYADAESLDRALAGIEAVYLVSAAGPHQLEQETAVIEAAVRAGGPRVVKQAAFGVDGDPTVFGRLVTAHARIVEVLRSSGLPYTVLAPNALLQNLLLSAALVQERGLLALPGGSAAVSAVDARDVAAVAGHVLTTEGHQGACYSVTGPESLTYAEVAARLSAVTGREVLYFDVEPPMARAAMIAAGRPEWVADGLLELFAGYRSGAAAAVTDEVHKATGSPGRSVETFLRDHRGAFAPVG